MEKIRQMGQVKLVQLQPTGLITDTPELTPTGYFYDSSKLVQVDQLSITPRGIEAALEDGEQVLDIHHMSHPDKEYDDDDLVCIGFTAHYQAMRSHFGDHLQDGIAGENIIIEYDNDVWPEDLSQKTGIENQDTGEIAVLEMVSHASPCVEFSQFCLLNQYEKVPAAQIKESLQFLANGRRGFLLVLSKDHELVTVKPGDNVFLLSEKTN